MGLGRNARSGCEQGLRLGVLKDLSFALEEFVF